MSQTDHPRHEPNLNQLYADERVELLETIQEIVSQEVERRLRGSEGESPTKNKEHRHQQLETSQTL